jgi:hypothetical protein
MPLHFGYKKTGQARFFVICTIYTNIYIGMLAISW